MVLEPPPVPSASSLEQEQGTFVFFSYAHRDKWLRDRLEDHLSNLKYRGIITTWYDQEIRAGEEWARQIDIYLNKARIILLLISSDFMASEYCYSREMKQALERHEQREADVIPILLRPVLFTGAPFVKLQMLPTNGKPVIEWRNRDSALVDIACGIEKVAQKYLPQTSSEPFYERIELPLLDFLPQLSPTLVDLPAASLGLPAERRLEPEVQEEIAAREEEEDAQNITLLPSLTAPNMVDLPAASLELPAERRLEPEAQEEAHRRKYYEEAIEAYRSALLSNPIDGNALRGMGNALYALERYNEALVAFKQARNHDPVSATFAGLGNVFAKLKHYGPAVEAYERAIELDSTVTFNNNDFIQSLLALGRKEDVEQALARAQQLGYEE